MKTVIEINMDNEAFCDEWGEGAGHQVAFILLKLATDISYHPHFSPGFDYALCDVNGNEVGYCAVREG